MGSVVTSIAGSVLGGVAGSEPDVTTTQRQVGRAGELEKLGGTISREQLEKLQDLVGLGASAGDVKAGVQAQRQFAQDIASLRDRGGVPTEEQFEQAGQFVEPQRVALEQRLEDERRRVARLAGRLGRTQDDPVLQAKLAQTAARGQERLSARQSQFAQQLPFQQLQLSQQLANVRQGLASQALQNRQTLLNLGSAVQGQQQQFRLGAAGTRVESGGGLKGAITGAFGGATSALNVLGGVKSLGGFGGNQGLGGNVSTLTTSGGPAQQGFMSNIGSIA